MLSKYFSRYVILLCLTASAANANDDSNQQWDVASLLAHPILPKDTPLEEVRSFAKSRIPLMPTVESASDWTRQAKQIRQDMFDQVVFRGEAVRWRGAKTKVVWLETIDGGPGYLIRKLRYEALPGLWIPALLYVPDNLNDVVPVVLNVNGHERIGKSVDYKQIRCINLAKRGMMALNPEWLGMGQLSDDEFLHYRMNQIDLCGTSGLAPFYLAMERGLDLLLSLDHADPERVAVTGVSGGGWQTIFIGALDSRVTLANPVAGYSSFLTRADVPNELGDSEQTPTDMATVADYCHLTALRAPRPTLLTFNAEDNCCFKADSALPPLLKAAEPVFQLFGKRASLRTHVNFVPGDHNYKLDNRLQFYRMIGEHFYPGDSDFTWEEILCEDELKTKEELHVDLPKVNANFNSLARNLAANLPKAKDIPTSRDAVAQWQATQRELLNRTVKAQHYSIEADSIGEQEFDGGNATFWQLKVGEAWTVPATELVRGKPTKTILLVADAGRKSASKRVEELLDSGYRVIAVDPFYFGESKIIERDFLYALLVSCVGERPLGIQASQLGAIARWIKLHHQEIVEVHAIGPRASLYSLVASAMEPTAIDAVNLTASLGSLKEILEKNMSVQESPELFCFGLLENFDIKQLVYLAVPRPVTFSDSSHRIRTELADLKEFYRTNGADFDPLQ